MSRPKIIVTSGEPAGIGPDICIELGQHKFDADITVLGDPVVFSQRAAQLGLDHAYKNLRLISVNTQNGVQAGRLDVANASMVLEQLDLAIQGCLRKNYDAVVTAPLHKGIINDHGVKFTGHTEYLAKKCGEKIPVMMLTCEQMRVALVTTHMPLKDVEKHITQNNIIHSLEVLYNDLRLRFGIERPTIAVCGLNPHAGEQGHLGDTEQRVIEPTLNLARQSGMNILGPLPADTAFTPKILDQVDAVLTMYHDQGLPVLKYASFGKGVNVTLGLPIIRASVDHGTALTLAGTGRADASSLLEAVNTAIDMVHIEKHVRAGKGYVQKAKEPEPSLLNENIEQLNTFDELDFDISQFSESDQQVLTQNLYDESEPLVSAEEIGLIGIPTVANDQHLKPSEEELDQKRKLEERKSKIELDRSTGQSFFTELDILNALKKQEEEYDEIKNKGKKKNDGEKNHETLIDDAIRTMTDIVF